MEFETTFTLFIALTLVPLAAWFGYMEGKHKVYHTLESDIKSVVKIYKDKEIRKKIADENNRYGINEFDGIFGSEAYFLEGLRATMVSYYVPFISSPMSGIKRAYVSAIVHALKDGTLDNFIKKHSLPSIESIYEFPIKMSLRAII